MAEPPGSGRGPDAPAGHDLGRGVGRVRPRRQDAPHRAVGGQERGAGHEPHPEAFPEAAASARQRWMARWSRRGGDDGAEGSAAATRSRSPSNPAPAVGIDPNDLDQGVTTILSQLEGVAAYRPIRPAGSGGRSGPPLCRSITALEVEDGEPAGELHHLEREVAERVPRRLIARAQLGHPPAEAEVARLPAPITER